MRDHGRRRQIFIIESEVTRRFAKASQNGHAFMLVCFDTFDRLHLDEDLGYYYPTMDTPLPSSRKDAQLCHFVGSGKCRASQPIGSWQMLGENVSPAAFRSITTSQKSRPSVGPTRRSGAR